MAIVPARRLNPDIIALDRTALLSLLDMHDYAPLNQAYSHEALRALDAALEQAEQEELRARNALAAARDASLAAAHALHEAILGAKAQVIAQYGSDSASVQAVGLKKKSERKRPARRRTAVPA